MVAITQTVSNVKLSITDVQKDVHARVLGTVETIQYKTAALKADAVEAVLATVATPAVSLMETLQNKTNVPFVVRAGDRLVAAVGELQQPIVGYDSLTAREVVGVLRDASFYTTCLLYTSPSPRD